MAVAALGGAAVATTPKLSQPTPSVVQPQAIEVQEPLAAPVRLKIPKLAVDAPIDPMGLTPAGDMEAPVGPHAVGWFKFGSHPGASGNAVIAGHYGQWKNGEGSVFDNLHSLSKGDTIYTEDERGAAVAFVVRDSRVYKPDQPAADVFFSNDTGAHLNLITCQGTWNNTQQSYSMRLVVFADKIE